MTRLRTPAVAAVAGGVLLLGLGFGSGVVVGRTHAGPTTVAGVTGGQARQGADYGIAATSVGLAQYLRSRVTRVLEQRTTGD